MSATDRLLQNNRDYASGFDKGGLAAPPALHVAVLTCMDARVDPARLLGFQEGDAHVIRNAGGVASDDAIRSLAISQRRLGTTEVIVIQHTDCGMESLSEDELTHELERDAGEPPPWPVHAFDDVQQSVRDSVRTLRETPFIPGTDVRGFVYDVRTGQLSEV